MNAIFVLMATALVALFVGVYNKRGWVIPIITIGLLSAAGLLLSEWTASGEGANTSIIAALAEKLHIDQPYGEVIQNYMRGMVRFDNFALAFGFTMVIATLFTIFLARDEFREYPNTRPDIYALLIFTLIGGILMAGYSHMAMLFIGYETLSISLYILAGSRKMDIRSNEASIKYFVMGSFSSGFMLFGMALVYGISGQLTLEGLSEYATANAGALPMIFRTGLFMILVGLLFKVSAVPFHFWAPDVYSGSPGIITAFMSSTVKMAAFAALARFLLFGFGNVADVWLNLMWVVAALTLIVGNLSAVFQASVKRMLAYSGVANAGFMLMALAAKSPATAPSLLYYVLAYSLSTILAFGILLLVARQAKGDQSYESFHGLARRNPWLTLFMCIAMFSLAGIPPLSGFFGKFYVIKDAFNANSVTGDSRFVWLITIAIAMSLVGVYYYIRVVAAMFIPDNTREPIKIDSPYAIALGVLAALVVIVGLFPNQIYNLLL